MPAVYSIESTIVFSYATGIFDLAVATQHMDRLLADSQFLPEFSQISDFSDVAEIRLAAEDVRTLALRKVFGPTSRRAFVVSSALQFGFSRMFGTYRDIHGEPNISVFKTLKEATSAVRCNHGVAETCFEKLRTLCDCG